MTKIAHKPLLFYAKHLEAILSAIFKLIEDDLKDGTVYVSYYYYAFLYS